MPCGGDATSWMLLMQLQSCSCINSIRPSNKRRIGTKEAQHTSPATFRRRDSARRHVVACKKRFICRDDTSRGIIEILTQKCCVL